MTIEEISYKYENIESKIPLIWKDWEAAGVSLAQDLWDKWDIKNSELIRVISLVGIRVKTSTGKSLNLSDHIDSKFAFAGLYPSVEKIYNVFPESFDGNTHSVVDMSVMFDKRYRYKKKMKDKKRKKEIKEKLYFKSPEAYAKYYVKLALKAASIVPLKEVKLHYGGVRAGHKDTAFRMIKVVDSKTILSAFSLKKIKKYRHISERKVEKPENAIEEIDDIIN